MDESSADLGLANNIPIGIDADHTDICKPTSIDVRVKQTLAIIGAVAARMRNQEDEFRRRAVEDAALIRGQKEEARRAEEARQAEDARRAQEENARRAREEEARRAQEEKARIWTQEGLRFELEKSGWHPCSFRGRQGTSVFGEWLVTNATDEDVWLQTVCLAKHEAEISDVSGGRLKGHCHLNGRARTRIRAKLDFYPPIIDGSGPLVDDVIFSGALSGSYELDSVKFLRVGL